MNKFTSAMVAMSSSAMAMQLHEKNIEAAAPVLAQTYDADMMATDSDNNVFDLA